LEPLELAYNLILNTAGYGVLPYLWSKAKDDPIFMEGRLGGFDLPPSIEKRPRLWFHAASVGEVTGAIPTLHAAHSRLPHAAIFLSVATLQGFRFAKKQLPGWTHVLPFPLDFPWVIKRAFNQLQPDLYVTFESEFWPNLYRFLERKGVPAVLLNGRISSRSARRYRNLKPLFQPVFERFRWLAMHSEEDRRNILTLGVPAEKTVVLGSSKYDGLSLRARPEKTHQWRGILSLPEDIPVVVAGSLRRSECLELMEVFQALRKIDERVVGIFVPRHLEQIPNMVQWLQEREIPFQLLSHIEAGEEKRRCCVVLVDRIGILFELYALGDLIFCGGTLEPIGGHNILEPAAWKKPVFYGPHLQKVPDEHRILQALKGSFPVHDDQDLQQQWSYWIRHLSELKPHGEMAGKALETLGGVAAKQVELLVSALPPETLKPLASGH